MLVEQITEDEASLRIKGLESFFISEHSGFDELEMGVLYFYDVVLARDLGTHKAGDKLTGLMLDINRTIIQLDLDENGENFHIFKFGF